MQNSILNVSDILEAGALFRPPDDRLRVDAFIPTIGRQSRAANLVELPNGDLLCARFAGSREGISDVNIHRAISDNRERKGGDGSRRIR